MFDNVYQGKTVMVTGHTGFKGSWLAIWLNKMGARVVGYALEPYSIRGNYGASHLDKHLYADLRGDTRDLNKLDAAVKEFKPEIIFHLAAQALVRPSYEQPRETFETNFMGSVNVMETMRKNDCLRTAVMITSDKCYENVEQIWGYKETDRMGGQDPYSASKGCTELMLRAYQHSYFNPEKYKVHGKAMATVRAGNVIGGGDWSKDRLIPDCIRSIEANKPIEIRNPVATRPWEHVLEPLSGYLRVGQKLMEEPVKYSTSFNFGPGLAANKPVREVVHRLVDYYGQGSVVDAFDPNAVHENTLLNLDVTKAYNMLQWEAKWNLDEMIHKTVDWYKEALKSKDMYDFCVGQIMAHGDHRVR